MPETETADRAIIRTRKVLAGQGMLTPRRAFRYGGQLFEPERTRVSVDYEAARLRPDLFRPAWDQDDSSEIERFREEQGLLIVDPDLWRRADARTR